MPSRPWKYGNSLLAAAADVGKEVGSSGLLNKANYWLRKVRVIALQIIKLPFGIGNGENVRALK